MQQPQKYCFFYNNDLFEKHNIYYVVQHSYFEKLSYLILIHIFINAYSNNDIDTFL